MTIGNNWGVVDLGALKHTDSQGATAGSAPAAGPSATSVPDHGAAAGGASAVAGPIVQDVTAENLAGVVALSSRVPVVLAFYSQHSPNSQQLVTTLRGLAVELGGRIALGLVSTDEQAQVAAVLGVQAVPAAAAVLQEQPIPLFQGLPSEDDLRQTLQKLLDAAAQYGIVGVLDDSSAQLPEPELPPLHKAGLEAMEAGDLDAAKAAFEKALKENPGDTYAKTTLAQVELLQRIESYNPTGDMAAVQKLLDLARSASMSDLSAQLPAADLEVAYNRPDAGFARLIDVVRETEGEEREAARKRLLELFDVVGTDSQLVSQARRALANVLF